MKNEPENPFDPEDELRAENEVIKLKLELEHGMLGMGGTSSLDPGVENQWLNSIYNFEQRYKNAKRISVYDFIGRPAYTKTEDIVPEQMTTELERVISLLEVKGLALDVLAEYDEDVIYKFITEELFEHETDDMQVEGMTKNFSYEEFHPNHKADIEEGMMEFLKHWFEQSFDEDSMILSDQMILPDGPVPTIISKQDVLHKLRLLFDSYPKFEDCRFAVKDIAFQWDELQGKGMGHAEGGVKYTAVLENAEEQLIEGAYKIYFSNEFGKWQVMYFVFPGFNW